MTIEELIAADVLPSWFGRHADGSRLTLADGRLADTVRGVRGGFIPIPDVPLERITRSEAAAYDRAVTDATAAWGELDPVIVGIRRSDRPRPGLEHMSLDIQAAPLGPSHYAKLNKWLGPPAEQRLAPVASNLVDVQASVRGGGLCKAGDHYSVPRTARFHFRGPGRRRSSARRHLEIGHGPVAAAGIPGGLASAGLARARGKRLGHSARRGRLRAAADRSLAVMFDRFTLLSFHREVLEQASPELRWEASPHPSQLRAHVADLQGTNLAQWVNQQGYKHAKMSLSNTQIASLLAEQFRVPDAESLAAAETVLDAQSGRPVGGQIRAGGQPGRHQTMGVQQAGRGHADQLPVSGLDLDSRPGLRGSLGTGADRAARRGGDAAGKSARRRTPSQSRRRPPPVRRPGRPEGVLTPLLRPRLVPQRPAGRSAARRFEAAAARLPALTKPAGTVPILAQSWRAKWDCPLLRGRYCQSFLHSNRLFHFGRDRLTHCVDAGPRIGWPSFASRAGTLVTVKWSPWILGPSSSHVSGTETGAPARARVE